MSSPQLKIICSVIVGVSAHSSTVCVCLRHFTRCGLHHPPRVQAWVVEQVQEEVQTPPFFPTCTEDGTLTFQSVSS